jgi:hypothetical protein
MDWCSTPVCTLPVPVETPPPPPGSLCESETPHTAGKQSSVFGALWHMFAPNLYLVQGYPYTCVQVRFIIYLMNPINVCFCRE